MKKKGYYLKIKQGETKNSNYGLEYFYLFQKLNVN